MAAEKPDLAAETGRRNRVLRRDCMGRLRMNRILDCAQNYGSPGRTRTADRVVNSHLLYQLSYRGSAERECYWPRPKRSSYDRRGIRVAEPVANDYLPSTGAPGPGIKLQFKNNQLY